MRVRKHLRVPLPIPVHIRTQEMSDFSLARIRDISWGGVFVIWDKKLKAGDRIILQIQIEEESVTLEMWGTIVRVETNNNGHVFGVGIEFDTLDDQTRSSIQKMVTSHIQTLFEHFLT